MNPAAEPLHVRDRLRWRRRTQQPLAGNRSPSSLAIDISSGHRYTPQVAVHGRKLFDTAYPVGVLARSNSEFRIDRTAIIAGAVHHAPQLRSPQCRQLHRVTIVDNLSHRPIEDALINRFDYDGDFGTVLKDALLAETVEIVEYVKERFDPAVVPARSLWPRDNRPGVVAPELLQENAR